MEQTELMFAFFLLLWAVETLGNKWTSSLCFVACCIGLFVAEEETQLTDAFPRKTLS